MDQKKKIKFKNRTRKIGGQNAMLTAVAGTQSFPIFYRSVSNQKIKRRDNNNSVSIKDILPTHSRNSHKVLQVLTVSF
jgi:hypothetical protein